MSRETIFRVQDMAGRGPYRPGFSHLWIDPRRPPEERPDILAVMPLYKIDLAPVGTHLGAGFQDPQRLRWWFQFGELKNLENRGYYPGFLEVDGILHEEPEQLVFYRYQPLRYGFTRITLRELRDLKEL